MLTDAHAWTRCHFVASGRAPISNPAPLPLPDWLRRRGVTDAGVLPLNALQQPAALRQMRVAVVPCIVLEDPHQAVLSYPLPRGLPDAAAWQGLAERAERGDAHLRTTATQADVTEVAQCLSHDLRGPVRNNARLIEVVLERAPLDTAARETLERVRQSMHDTASRIDALVQFLRIGQANLSPTLVDASALCSQLAAELAGVCGSAAPRLQIAPNMAVSADLQLLTLALRHLLENAIKFSRDVAAPEVQVSMHAAPGFDVIDIGDNGAGFSAVHAGALFRPFERIHLHSEFPGHGIGLALVRRVAERHGGWSWSDVGTAGWTHFLLALPSAPAHG